MLRRRGTRGIPGIRRPEAGVAAGLYFYKLNVFIDYI